MTDPATFAVAQDLLKRHGIPSFLRGETHTWAIGTPVPLPFHPAMGPLLLVERRHAGAATKLLAGMQGTSPARKPKQSAGPNWIQRTVRRLLAR